VIYAVGTILAIGQYAPANQASKTVSGGGVTTFAAFDTMNLTTPSFVAPPSGNVIVDVDLNLQTNSAAGKMFLTLGAHGSVTPLCNRWQCTDNASGAARMYRARFYVTGLTAGTSYQLDLLGAGTTGTTVTILAFGDNGATPSTNGGSPVTFTVTSAP